jgi:hypothetical protein
MGDDKHAMVAVSTKYLKTYQGGWTSDTGACNKCMCVRMHGGDDSFNSGLQKEAVNKRIGLTFMAKVGVLLLSCSVMWFAVLLCDAVCYAVLGRAVLSSLAHRGCAVLF